MIGAWKAWTDRLFGRGDASISVPVLDGALKSNQWLEEATVVAELDAPEDLATDGAAVYVADGARLLRLDPSGVVEVLRLERPIRAIACLPGGGMALALDGREIRVVGGAFDGRSFDSAASQPLHCVNALRGISDHRLIATEGSKTQPPERWKHDLMELGRSGRLLEFDLKTGTSRELEANLAYAFGACDVGSDEVWVCESWRHRVIGVGGTGAKRIVVDALPGYPSRIVPAPGGGYWLTVFTMRTQLVEFVLREPAFRRRMLKEIDPRYWIAPALSSGNTFLEPLQVGHLKTMGIVKPWAPPRSYGLVIRLTSDGLIRYSLHSRFDGANHGVVAAVECGEQLYVLAKGCGRVLRLNVADVERSFTT